MIISESEHQNVRWDHLPRWPWLIDLPASISRWLSILIILVLCSCVHSSYFVLIWNGTVFILKLFWPASKGSDHFNFFVEFGSYVCTKVCFFLSESKMTLFTFYSYFAAILTFLISRCRWIYLWSCWEGLIVVALQGRFSIFMCVLKFSFFWRT